MPEKPPFNPALPYSEPKRDAKPAFDSNKPFSETKQDVNKDYYDALQFGNSPKGKPTEQVNQPDFLKPDYKNVIDRIEFDFGDPNTEGKKAILKDLAESGASQEVLSNSILTLQGKHPKQQGGYKYYIDEFGIPNPISNNERPPAGYDVASVWGIKKQAQDDNFITNLSKHVINGVVGVSKGAVAVGDAVQGFITGTPSETAQGLQNSAEYLKFETKDFKPIYTGEKYWDLLKPEKYDFNYENVAGNAMQGLESIITFALGAKGIGTVMKGGKAVAAGAKGLNQVAQLTRAQQIAANATSAYNMALSESIEDARNAGLEGRDAYTFATIAAIPQAGLEVAFGPEAMVLRNQFAQAAKEEFKGIVKEAAKKIEKDASGKITKEALDQLSKEMATEATKLSLKYRAKDVAQNIAGEAVTEGLQTFADEATKQLYDKVSGDPKFNADAFSPESVNKIVNSTIAGALGSFGPSIALSASNNNIEQENERSKQVFRIIQSGEDAIKAFKKNVFKEQQEGNITQEEANDAITRLNSYKEYNDITTSSRLNIDPEKKREIFDKTFQKQNIESTLAQMGNPENLHPLKLAEYNSLAKQSKDLQKEIDAVVLESQIKKQTVVADKTVKDVEKKEQQPETKKPDSELLKAFKDKYKPTTLTDKRTFEEVPVEEYNSTLNNRFKHKITADWLDSQQGKTAFGTVAERKFSYKGKTNSVLGIQLSDGRKLRFASSMLRPEGYRGHYRQEQFETEFPVGTPIGIKVVEIPAFDEESVPKKVIKAFKADTGKFVGWMKETTKGQSDYSPEQKDALAHMETIDEPPLDLFNEAAQPKQPLVPVDESISKPEDLPITGNIPTLAKDENKNTINREESTPRDDNQADTKAKGQLSETKLRTGTKKANRAIKHPEQRFALDREVFSPYDLALKYFINKGNVDPKDLKEFFGDKSEFNQRIQLVKNGALTRKGIAHKLWEDNSELNFDVIDYINAVEDVLREFTSRTQMARSINERYAKVLNQDFSPQEQELSEQLDLIETPKELTFVEDAVDEIESETDQKVMELSEDEEGNLKWIEAKGIITNDDLEEQFQKNAEVDFAEKQLVSAEKELRKAKKEYESKKKELDAGLIKDQEDLFGQRQSDSPDLLFNERATLDARNEAVAPLKAKYEKAIDDYKKAYDKLKEAQGRPDSQTSLFEQRKSLNKKDVLDEITRVIQKNFPKVKVVYDSTIKFKGSPVSGRLKGDTLSINPFYAGNDTPIHEAAHIMLDAMGDIPAVRLAVKQLKETPLWKETEGRYPELSGKALENEVLAEAIGREGADIFESEYEKNKFLQYLQYIFDWLKRNLGLEKNVAQNLARQIIYGINTRKKVAKTEKYQKEFEDFSEKRGSEAEEDLKQIDELLKSKELTKEEKAELKEVRGAILDRLAQDKKAFRKYKKTQKQIKNLGDLSGYSLEELTEMYNVARQSGNKKVYEEAKENIARFINQKQLELLRQNDKFIEENADKKDMSWAFMWTGALSEVSEKFPIIQSLNNIFREKSINQIEETNSLKRKHEKLARAVIKEKNGLLGKASELISSDSAKYFEYLDDNGQLRTNTNGLTKAQIDYLEFVRELTKDKIPDEVTESQLIKIDPGFREVYRNEGLIPAINSYINKSATDQDVTFYNPETKREETASYLSAQKTLIEYAKKNPVKGIIQLIKLSKKVTKPNSDFYMKKNGQLTSKFDKPRPKGKGYSKDFYRAVNAYIDDKMHIKYMADVVPIVDSVESFYRNLGIEEGKDFKNTLEFLEEWKARQLYQESTKETIPVLDKAFSALRHFTSLVVMSFNVPANLMNAAIGNYNTIRKDGFVHFLKGQKRLFIGKNRAGYGAVNKYALDILKKYNVVNVDSSANPRATAGKLLSQLAFLGLKTGEINIQGAEFLGHMTDTEFNSFEYDSEGELQIKESLSEEEKRELKRKINEYKYKVSSVQGKYSDKDTRNFMRFEAGRSAAQFKLWTFDWFRTRFGSEIINSYGETERGSLSKAAIKDIRNQVLSMDTKVLWKNKEFKQNLFGAIVVGVLLAATYEDDDDKEMRKKMFSLNNALEQILFVYDIQQAEYILKNPVASLTPLFNFFDALEAAMDADEKKFKKSAKKLVPYGKVAEIPE